MKYKELIHYFAQPRMNTWEFENSKLKCDFHYVINNVYFDDGISEYPSMVSGAVRMERGLTLVCWNRFGECFIKGRRFNEFDLISPLRKVNYSQIFVIAGGVGISVLVAILYITR